MSEKNRKSAEEENSKTSGNLSRRNFLKNAGIVIGSSAIGSIAVATGTEAQKKYDSIRPNDKSLSKTESTDSILIELTVNGGKHQFRVESNWSLRQLLRDEIGLTSPKDWCGGLGACGSCTVIMNGKAVLSCLTLACECNGAIIETAEGIAKSGHPLIQSYINRNAFQCGYCTPGFVTTAKALLDRNPDPTEADVRDALGGNLCRCATYQQHPPAVLDAAIALKKK